MLSVAAKSQCMEFLIVCNLLQPMLEQRKAVNEKINLTICIWGNQIFMHVLTYVHGESHDPLQPLSCFSTKPTGYYYYYRHMHV